MKFYTNDKSDIENYTFRQIFQTTFTSMQHTSITGEQNSDMF